MGNTIGSEEEIIKISEIKPNVLDAKGILIATFSSMIEPNELTDWFTSRDRSFLLFELNSKSSGYNIVKKEIEDGLFGFLKNIDVDKMNEEFLKTINVKQETKPQGRTKKANKDIKDNKPKNVLDASVIEKMTSHEKNELLNELIDNGIDNLSEHDKTLLHLLVK